MDHWCEAWPQEVKDAVRQQYRAKCKLRCLESALDRTDPEDFDELMSQIEEAQAELLVATRLRVKLMGMH